MCLKASMRIRCARAKESGNINGEKIAELMNNQIQNAGIDIHSIVLH